jgi:spore germination cell wall hydrolase CwlJ-like protein
MGNPEKKTDRGDGMLAKQIISQKHRESLYAVALAAVCTAAMIASTDTLAENTANSNQHTISQLQLEYESHLKKEIECLALNIYHESRGEPYQGQLGVAYVTMNRVVNPNYPDTVCEVVFQYKQFSWTHDTRSDRPDDRIAWDKSVAVADYVYKNYYYFMEIARGSPDVTRGALYFYAPDQANPDWAREMVATATIGRHIFLRKEKANL